MNTLPGLPKSDDRQSSGMNILPGLPKSDDRQSSGMNTLPGLPKSDDRQSSGMNTLPGLPKSDDRQSSGMNTLPGLPKSDLTWHTPTTEQTFGHIHRINSHSELSTPDETIPVLTEPPPAPKKVKKDLERDFGVGCLEGYDVSNTTASDVEEFGGHGHSRSYEQTMKDALEFSKSIDWSEQSTLRKMFYNAVQNNGNAENVENAKNIENVEKLVAEFKIQPSYAKAVLEQNLGSLALTRIKLDMEKQSDYHGIIYMHFIENWNEVVNENSFHGVFGGSPDPDIKDAIKRTLNKMTLDGFIVKTGNDSYMNPRGIHKPVDLRKLASKDACLKALEERAGGASKDFLMHGHQLCLKEAGQFLANGVKNLTLEDFPIGDVHYLVGCMPDTARAQVRLLDLSGLSELGGYTMDIPAIITKFPRLKHLILKQIPVSIICEVLLMIHTWEYLKTCTFTWNVEKTDPKALNILGEIVKKRTETDFFVAVEGNITKPWDVMNECNNITFEGALGS